MACGTPLVASRVGALPELIGDDAGVLMAPGDSTALASALHDVLTDPHRAAGFGTVGRRRAVTTYSWAAVARATTSIYDQARRAAGRVPTRESHP